jgi:DNA-binding Xre family transcriptional regulator
MNKEIFNALKSIIKKRNLNYKLVAESISMSESALKRLMANEDCSLKKLDQICRSINISIAELVEYSEYNGYKELTLNSKQEELFLKKPECYHFFDKLVEYNYDWKKLAKDFNLTKKSCLMILLKLDKVGLLSLEPGDNVREIQKISSINISAKLAKVVAWKIDDDFYKYAQSEFLKKKKNCMGSRSNYHLKKSSVTDLTDSLNEVIKEFTKRSKREEIVYGKENLIEITLLSYLAEGFDKSKYMKIK